MRTLRNSTGMYDLDRVYGDEHLSDELSPCELSSKVDDFFCGAIKHADEMLLAKASEDKEIKSLLFYIGALVNVDKKPELSHQLMVELNKRLTKLAEEAAQDEWF